MLVVANRPAPSPLLWQPPPRSERAVYQSWLKAQRLWQPPPPRQPLADEVAQAIAIAEEASWRVEQEQLARELRQAKAALQFISTGRAFQHVESVVQNGAAREALPPAPVSGVTPLPGHGTGPLTLYTPARAAP